jgi:hypothetical protein
VCEPGAGSACNAVVAVTARARATASKALMTVDRTIGMIVAAWRAGCHDLANSLWVIAHRQIETAMGPGAKALSAVARSSRIHGCCGFRAIGDATERVFYPGIT